MSSAPVTRSSLCAEGAPRKKRRVSLRLVDCRMGAGPGPDHGFLDDLTAVSPLDLDIAAIDHRYPAVFSHASVQDRLASVDKSGHSRLILGVETVGLMPRDLHLDTNRPDDAKPSWHRCRPT